MNLGGPGPVGGFGMNSPLGPIVSGSGGSSMGPQPSSPSRMFGGSIPSSSGKMRFSVLLQLHKGVFKLEP